MRKTKLSVSEQIQHMKDKGIRFDIVSESDAERFLTTNTYYFKIKSYAKNYEKYHSTDKKGTYINLDFAYLQELSTLDMHIRHFIMSLSLDLEHSAKVKLLSDFNLSPDDGYRIVELFMNHYPNIKDEIKSKKNNSFCMDLVDKLIAEDFAIWNIVEVLSLKDFLYLYREFQEEYPKYQTGINLYYPFQSVRRLRNAAAHSNCLINSLGKPYTSDKIKENKKVSSFVSKVPGIDKTARINHMSNPVVHDFVTLLYLLDKVIESAGIKRHYLEKLDYLFNVRMLRHKDFFQSNNNIRNTYIFAHKIVDYLICKGI